MKNTVWKYLAYSLLGLAILTILSYQISLPAEPYFDEVHYVKFVRALIGQNIYLGYASQHPPLWHLLMALAVEFLGDHPFSWRIVSLLAHIGVMIVTFLIARRITKNPTVAWLAVFLLLFDCLSLTQARIAMMNSLMALFTLSSIYWFLAAFEKPSAYDHGALRRAGILWALALSTKMVSINLLFFFGPLMLAQLWQRRNERLALVKDWAVYFMAVPVLISMCVFSFVPLLNERSIADIWGIQAFNLHYHATTTQTHPYTSRWWSWPLMLRPICFYFSTSNWETPASTCRMILAIGNPVLFWMIPFAVFYVLWEFLKNKSRVHGLVLLGILSQWMTFGFGSRMQFFHYFYQAMPFVVMALAFLLAEIWTWGRWGKIFVAVYLMATVGMFIYWYPLLTGLEISRASYYQHMWFRSWI